VWKVVVALLAFQQAFVCARLAHHPLLLSVCPASIGPGWGCKPEPQIFPSTQLQPCNERVQVNHLAVTLEGVVHCPFRTMCRHAAGGEQRIALQVRALLVRVRGDAPVTNLGGQSPKAGFRMVTHGDMVFRTLLEPIRRWRKWFLQVCRKTNVLRQAHAGQSRHAFRVSKA
jgi:hypothetical protein